MATIHCAARERARPLSAGVTASTTPGSGGGGVVRLADRPARSDAERAPPEVDRASRDGVNGTSTPGGGGGGGGSSGAPGGGGGGGGGGRCAPRSRSRSRSRERSAERPPSRRSPRESDEDTLALLVSDVPEVGDQLGHRSRRPVDGRRRPQVAHGPHDVAQR